MAYVHDLDTVLEAISYSVETSATVKVVSSGERVGRILYDRCSSAYTRDGCTYYEGEDADGNYWEVGVCK